MMELSPRGKLLLEAARRNFELVREHGEKESKSEALFIFTEQIKSIRNTAPHALAFLSMLETK